MTTSEELNDAIWSRTTRNASVVRGRTVFVADDVTVIRSGVLRALLTVAGDQATLAEALGVSRSTISRALAEAGETSDDRQARIQTVRALLGPDQAAGNGGATPDAEAPEAPLPAEGAPPADHPLFDALARAERDDDEHPHPGAPVLDEEAM